MNWSVLVGDVRDQLATVPDASVQTCVTSPPYWGLRDYGTAKWEGGDPACDHRVMSGGPSQLEGASQRGRSDVAKGDCRRCGARRVDSQIGLEPTPDEFVANLVAVFRDVRRVLNNDGTLWVNLGDSYLAQQGAGFNGQKRLDHANRNVKVQRPLGMKPKDLAGIPWMVAFALRADGWYLRSDIIWHKPNPMPESVTDRPTKAHEYVFLLSKNERYFYDAESIKEAYSENSHGGLEPNQHKRWGLGLASLRTTLGMRPYTGQAKKDYDAAGAQNPSDTKRRVLESMINGNGRNARSVWTITTQPYPDAHFATFPEALPERCIKAGSRIGDTVLDPFMGSGTTGQVALRLGRAFVGIELNPAYAQLARERIGNAAPLFTTEVSA